MEPNQLVPLVLSAIQEIRVEGFLAINYFAGGLCT
jgi:hypothetical protein